MIEEMTKRRPNLGRGLDALFADVQGGSQGLRHVAIGDLHASALQPRRRFDEAELDALAQSIREQGVLQPIVVRPSSTGQARWEIVAGERRWRAAQRARLHEVPVIERRIDDRDALQIAIIENVQRSDLSPLEEAEGYRRLMGEFGQTQEDVARVVGKSRSHVANTLRLLDLPELVRDLLGEGRLTAGHARALLACPDPVGAARAVVERGLNVRQTEALARNGAAPASRGRQRKDGRDRTGVAANDPDTAALERELEALLGLEVRITTGGSGGTLAIRWRTLDQLDEVLGRLSGVRG